MRFIISQSATGGITAVSDLSFTIESGQIYGLLGPNGAGKTTTMNILTGCLAATEGEVKIAGYDIFEEAEKAKRLIGYLPEQPPLYPDMTPEEYLKFVAKVKGIGKTELSGQIEKVINVTRIQDMRHRLIRNLSKGYKQRVGVAQALLGNPQVIILDEPTVGLDPKQIIEIRDLIKELGKNHTVILSSHILSEVQAVCDHIMIISRGKLVASDTPENLEKLYTASDVLNLTVKGKRAQVEEVLREMDGVEGFQLKDREDGTIGAEVRCSGTEEIRDALIFAFSDKRLPVIEITAAKASLEDIFLEFTEGGALAEAQVQNGKEE